MRAHDPQATRFQLTGAGGQILRGEEIGSGREVFLCHGLSATRRYVVHGSRYLSRHGYRLITYDARGHGDSDPGPDGYGYDHLVADLDRVIEDRQAAGPSPEPGDGIILGGHSMGCHTVLSRALRQPEGVAALILVGPVFLGSDEDVDEDAAMESWEKRAEALERGGPDAFGELAARGSPDGEIGETIARLARDRARLHQNRGAAARALREVARSRPFGDVTELRELDLPVLVVGSHDAYDPTHPLAVAERYAGELPRGELICEGPDDSPLAWQGGRLSRAIDEFLVRNDVGGIEPDDPGTAGL